MIFRAVPVVCSVLLLLASSTEAISGTESSVLDDAVGVTLRSQIARCEFPGENTDVNDIWGYVSASGREYGIVGLYNGLSFVEVTNPDSLVQVEFIEHPESFWGDIRTFGEYAYSVIENVDGADGIRVIDLSQIDSGIVSEVRNVSEEGHLGTHNIVVNEESATLYACGANIYDKSLVAFDLSDPARPTIVGAWEDGARVHDAYVTTYSSGDWAGREIAFCACEGDGLYIVDVTDKSNFRVLSHVDNDTWVLCHQVWVDTEAGVAYINDEYDEIVSTVPGTTTYMVDVSDLEAPVELPRFTREMAATDHNLYGRWGFLFEVNYKSGLRVIDVRDLSDVHEVGYFDTYDGGGDPELDDAAGTDGARGVYPYLPSGIILVSDIREGLLVLDASEATGVPIQDAPPTKLPELADRLLVHPNPSRAATSLTFALEEESFVRVQVYDASGRWIETLVSETRSAGQHSIVWDPREADNVSALSGVYFAVLETDHRRVFWRAVRLR